MTKAKYVGDHQNEVPEELTAFGVTFPKGKSVEIPEKLVAKFQGNPHFAVQGAKEEAEPKPLPRVEGVPTELDGAVTDPRDKTPGVDGKK